MRKFFSCVLLSTGLSLTAYAQTNVIKFQPVPLGENIISLGYERRLSDKGSFQLNVDYARETDFGFRSTWLGASIEYRIYGLIPALATKGQIAPEGFFVAPTVGYRSCKEVDLDARRSLDIDKYSFVQLGAWAGYQWLPTFKNGVKPLALEASVGLLGGLMLNGDAEEYIDFGLNRSSRFSPGLVPAVNISIGFVFGK